MEIKRFLNIYIPIQFKRGQSSYFPEKETATAMGFFQAIFSLGMFGGPLLVGWMGNLFGLTGSFMFVSGLSLIGFYISAKWISSLHSINLM